MLKHLFRATLSVSCAILIPGAVHADWIMVNGSENAPTIAEIYVEDDHVKVVLEVYIGDLVVLGRILPDALFGERSAQREPERTRLRRFARQDFQLVTERGRHLPVRVELVEPRLRKDRSLPFQNVRNPYARAIRPPEDKRVAYAELIYPFDGKPETITFIPPRDSNGTVAATIGFIVYHKSVPVIDFRYLSTEERLVLDWEDPWYTKFDNPNLKRHHKSALMAYLYVEPYEVRHEVLTRVKDLEAWMDLELETSGYIEPGDWAGLKQRVGEFIAGKNPLRIDGYAARPILDRVDFVRLGLRGLNILTEPERLDVSTAIIGVILAYPTEGLPQHVTVQWELFTDRIQSVPATSVDPAGPFFGFLTPDDVEFEWTNFLKNFSMPTVESVTVQEGVTQFAVPAGSIACLALLIPVVLRARDRRRGSRPWAPWAGAGIVLLTGSIVLWPLLTVSVAKPAGLARDLTQEEARTTLHNLLRNVYRAFDFRDEEDVYDKLAVTASGDLLTELYLQNRKSFAVKQAGGAQARVQNVEILEVEARKHPDRSFAYDFDATWTALGTVGHWGHTHVRQNRYHATVTVEAVESHWKIVGLELLDEERIDPYAPQDTSATQP